VKPIHIGCSGWNYQSWRNGVFYPPRCPASRWLEYYSRHFDTVEVNSTFYRLASAKAVENWVRQTPEQFVFSLKASQYLTHIKRLTDLDQGVQRYYERIEALQGSPKLGPILWQLPPNFQRDEERLEGALASLPEGRHCFEFRHPTWFVPNVYAMLRAYGVALAIGDRKGLDFQPHEMTTDWTFVRFHYGHRGRRGNYSESELEEWAQRFELWRERVEIFAYFNNDWEGFAPRNALWMRRRLGV
jgi:uncharacterized protein YecE (DUF72 family)